MYTGKMILCTDSIVYRDNAITYIMYLSYINSKSFVMYSRFVILIIRHAYGLCAVKEYNKITLISTSMVYNLISLLMLPVNIRLAGQLVMQVFKYRFIVRHHATDPDENKVMTAYYQHFQVALAIVFCILGFNVFNFIFQLYLSVSVAKDEWDREYEIGYYTGVIAQVFQEAIMLFGLTLVLQFDYYFKDEKFEFKRFLIAIVLRVIYLLNLEFVVGTVLPKFSRFTLFISFFTKPFISIGCFGSYLFCLQLCLDESKES